MPGYNLIERLHEGTSSTTWRAEAEDGTRCVLKVLNTDFPNQQELQSIRREYELAQQLSDLMPTRALLDFDSSLALRMDVDGITLQEWLTHGALSPKQTLTIIGQMCQIIAPLHEKGLVHGNLQPAHWLWDSTKQSLYLLTLGRAWATPGPTISTNILDLRYIAPEQTGRMASHEVDARADLYAIGAMMFECLDGHPAHDGDSAMAIISSHIAQETPPLVHPTAPWIEACMRRLMEKDCAARYQSAAGVMHDVFALQRALADDQLDEPFALGQMDVRHVLSLDPAFHGHPKAMGELLRAFSTCLESRCQLVFLQGAHGVGKTRLLQTLQGTLLEEENVIFLNSRFARHSQKPYGVLVDIIRQFTHQALMRDTETIDFWRHRILQGAQDQAAVLTEAVPEMELIIGPQPPLSHDREEETLHVLHETMSGVVQSIVTTTHPFVLCLDDVHMADIASLKLMVRLLNALKHRPILVVAAADTETWEISPTIQSVLSELDAEISMLKLKTLTPEAVTSWLASTLQQPATRVRPLAEMGHAYTNGHPQLFAQWVQDLYDQSLLYFDTQQHQWRWEHDAIRAKIEQIPLNALIQTRYKRLPEHIQDVLSVACCFVEDINIEIVQHILEISTLDLHSALTTAQEAGILSRHATPSSTRTRWSFAYKAVQQSIDDKLSVQTKTLYHLRIGRAFERLGQLHQDQDDYIHPIVYHLNLAKNLLSPEEQVDLIQLNVRAGRQIRQATAFDRAVAHFNQAHALLTPMVWRTHRALALAFVHEACLACLAAQDYTGAQSWVSLYEAHAETEEAFSTAATLQIDVYFSQMKNRAGIEAALAALERLGFHFSEDPSYLSLATGSVKLQTQLFGVSDADLIDAPVMTDPTAKQAMSIMYAVISAAYISNETIALLFVLKMVALSRQYGVSEETPMAYASFGYILAGSLNQIERGYRFGKIALALADKHTTGSHKAYAQLCVYNYIAPWKDPATQQLEPLFDAYKIARDAGAHECACFCLLDRLKHAWFAGRSVDKLRDSLEQMRLYADQTRMVSIQAIHEPWFALFDAVQHHTTLDQLDHEAPSPQIQQWFDHNVVLTTLIYATYFHDLALAKRCLDKLQHVKRQIINVMEMSTVQMLTGIYHARCARRHVGLERQTHLAKLLIHIGRLKHWSHYAPHNHKHRLILLEAEYAKLTDRPRKAARNYDESIRLAVEQGFNAEAALASERACRFYQARHQHNTAARYLEICDRYYSQAGYHSKEQELRLKYNELTVEPKTEGHLALNQPQDMQALFHAMEILSGEMVLERLNSKLLDVVIEHSGAQRAVIILRQENNTLSIAKEAVAGDQQATLEAGQNLDDITHQLATGMIHLSARTKEAVVLEHAAQSMQFFSDPYIKNNAPRSLMCLPILRQDRLLALVYLENKLTQGTFTHDKQQILHLLSSHIAISLENAMLYATMEQKVNERTMALEEAMQALEQAASRDYLTGVYNRLKFTDIANTAFKSPGPHSLILLDLDRFKQVNDLHGHQVGDEVLMHITHHIERQLDETHTLARWGGEEFVILLPNTDQTHAERIADSLREYIRKHPQHRAGTITFSAGVAQFRQGEGLDQLIHRADTALYQAKDSGRNRVIGYTQAS